MVEVKDKGQSSRQFSYMKPYPNPKRKGMRGHTEGEPEEIEVNLNFGLRIDIPDEMECFLACMEVAKADIEAQLAETKAKIAAKTS